LVKQKLVFFDKNIAKATYSSGYNRFVTDCPTSDIFDPTTDKMIIGLQRFVCLKTAVMPQSWFEALSKKQDLGALLWGNQMQIAFHC